MCSIKTYFQTYFYVKLLSVRVYFNDPRLTIVDLLNATIVVSTRIPGVIYFLWYFIFCSTAF